MTSAALQKGGAINDGALIILGLQHRNDPSSKGNVLSTHIGGDYNIGGRYMAPAGGCNILDSWCN